MKALASAMARATVALVRTCVLSLCLGSLAFSQAPESDGSMTDLLAAAQADNITLAASLLDAGADANPGNRYGITPLWLAATNRSAAMTELLLQHGADASAEMPHGETALMAAARAGDSASLRLLLAAGANPNAFERPTGETALMWAAAENHADAIRVLVAGGADPDSHSKALDLAPMDWIQVGMVSTILPVGGWTALMVAARQNSAAAALALAEVGADLDAQDPDGTTALIIAIINAHYDLASALLDVGADPDVADAKGMTALYAAVDMVTIGGDIGRPKQPQLDRFRAIDVVRLALMRGANPNAQLASAIIGRHHGFGDFSLGAGATALMRAAKSTDLDSMRLLLEAGADPTLALANGSTVIDLVAGGGGRGGGGLIGFGGGQGGRGGPPNEEALALLAEFAD
jgi:ankyrin repeat protein